MYFTDPDGKYIDISGLSERHQKAFKKFLGTKEGHRFLLLYGSAGQDVLGYKVDKGGKYSKHTVWYETVRNPKKGAETWPYSVSKSGITTRAPQGKNMTSKLAFLVQIDVEESEFEAVETIGHESFVHIEERTKKFNELVDKFLRGGYEEIAKNKGTSEAFHFTLDFTTLLNSEEENKEEHKYFVNGEDVSYENFIRELGSLFKNHSDEEKKKTKNN